MVHCEIKVTRRISHFESDLSDEKSCKVNEYVRDFSLEVSHEMTGKIKIY